MKRILYFAAAALMLAACNQKEPVATPDPVQISVVKSDVIFDALGGTGKITVSAKGSVKATSASDWCQVSVSGSDINVTAAQNDGLDGRASRITLECNGESIYLTAQQTGMVYTFSNANYLVEMAGGEIKVMGESTFAVSAESKVDWINASEIDGGYLLTIPFNDSGDSREGTFVITCGDIQTVYTIKQKFERNFTGTYEMVYYTSKEKTTEKVLEVTLTQDSSDENVYWLGGIVNGADIKMTYNPSTEQIVIKNGYYVGPYSETEWMYICVNYTTDTFSSNYYSISTDAKYDIYFSYKMVGGKYVIDLYNSAPLFNAARVSTGFAFYSFTTDASVALATANRKSTLLTISFPTLTQK